MKYPTDLQIRRLARLITEDPDIINEIMHDLNSKRSNTSPEETIFKQLIKSNTKWAEQLGLISRRGCPAFFTEKPINQPPQHTVTQTMLVDMANKLSRKFKLASDIKQIADNINLMTYKSSLPLYDWHFLVHEHADDRNQQRGAFDFVYGENNTTKEFRLTAKYLNDLNTGKKSTDMAHILDNYQAAQSQLKTIEKAIVDDYNYLFSRDSQTWNNLTQNKDEHFVIIFCRPNYISNRGNANRNERLVEIQRIICKFLTDRPVREAFDIFGDAIEIKTVFPPKHQYSGIPGADIIRSKDNEKASGPNYFQPPTKSIRTNQDYGEIHVLESRRLYMPSLTLIV